MAFKSNILDELQENSICFLDLIENSMKIELFVQLLNNGRIPVFFPRDWANNEKENFFENYEYSAYYINKDLEFKFNHKKNKIKLKGYGSFTSGRKSNGNLCFFDLKNAIACAKAHFSSLGIKSDYKIYNFIGLEHSFGILVHIIASYFLDYETRLLSSYDNLEFNSDDKKENIALHTTPKGLAFLLEYNVNLIKNINIISIGSDFLSRDTFDNFRALNQCDFFITYGLSEMGPRVTTFNKNENTKPEDDQIQDATCIGKPLEGIEVKILNTNHDLVNAGEGYLAIKSPYAAVNLNTKLFKSEYFISENIVHLAENGLIYLKREGHHIKHNDFLWTTHDMLKDIEKIPHGLFVVVCREGLREKMYVCLSRRNEALDLDEIFKRTFLINAMVHLYDEAFLFENTLHKINSKIISKLLKIEAENIIEWTNVFVKKS